MLIKLGYFVKNLYLKNRKYPITFTYGGVHSIKVLLKKSSKKIPPVKGNDDISICRTWGTFKPSDKVKQYFLSISNKIMSCQTRW